MLTFKIVNGDVPFNQATGRPAMLSSTDKFTQDVGQALDIVANLNGVIGLVGDVFSLRAEISRRIDAAFAAYKAAQDTVQKSDRPPEERFSRIVQVVVVPIRGPSSGSYDMTTFAFRVDALSVKGSQPASITGVLAR